MAKAKSQEIVVAPANFQTMLVTIRGTAPYVQHKFSDKARKMMREKQEAGSTGNAKKKREAKDFQEQYESAIHRTADGWAGIPAPGIRAAMISACRVCGIVMTRAKLTTFVEADGFDEGDGTPLVKITKGEPHYHEAMVRLETGVADVRARPMWHPGWEAEVRIRWDADQMSATDVLNLLHRAGQQVGIGEGRYDSKKSTGIGWGLFEVATSTDAEAA